MSFGLVPGHVDNRHAKLRGSAFELMPTETRGRVFPSLHGSEIRALIGECRKSVP